MHSKFLYRLTFKKDFVFTKEIHKKSVFQFYTTKRRLEIILFQVFHMSLVKCNL